jgi:hypothetical protein
MRHFAILAALSLTVTVGARTAAAEEKGAFGLGLILGEPTGIAAKLYLTDDTAFDAAIGGAVVGSGIQAHFDYLWHPWILTNETAFVMPAYVGIGARVLDHDRGDADDDFHAGARVVGGILFDFREIPLDVFIEVAFIAEWQSSGDDDHGGFGPALNAGIGGRYYF